MSRHARPRLRRLLVRRRLAVSTAVVLLSGAVVGGAAASGAAVAAPAPVPAAPAVTSAPDRASASAAARSSGRRVEVLGERTEASQLFANPSGTFTQEQHNQPQRVRRGDSWVPIDTTLRLRRDGTVAPVAAAADMVFSGGGTGPLVRVREKGSTADLGWPGRLPAPTLKGDQAAYADVLPGVDLVVRAARSGFSHVLAVKSAAAAKNPALRRLGFSVSGKGLSVRRDKSGSLTVRNVKGAEVMSAGTPMMWDAGATARSDARAAATDASEKPVPVEESATGFALLPDRALLDGAGTKFPLFIDPWWTVGRWAWTSVWERFGTTSYWNRNQINWDDPYKGVVRSGYEAEEGNRVRSIFRMNVQAFRGKQVINAIFRITESWSWSCSPRNLYLSQTGPIHPGTTWANQPSWDGVVGSGSVARGNEERGCGDGPVELWATAPVQRAAENHWDEVNLGLHSDENDTYGWKRFWLDPVLVVEYNSPPDVPTGLYADINLPCTSGASRPVTNTVPTMWATGSDPEGGTVAVQFEWWNTGGGAIGANHTGWVASGSRFSMAFPAELVVDGRSYSWRARTADGQVWGPWSNFCEFAVDKMKPTALPEVESTDYPANGAGVSMGTRGTFTFSSGDGDVAGYRYGLTENATYFVAAGTALGRPATVPVTVWDDAPKTLFVYSVDKAGNDSDTYTQYRFAANEAVLPAPRVRGDFNADGLADVTIVNQRDDDETEFRTFTSMRTGFYQPTRTWDSGRGTAFRPDRMQTVNGDFNGDSRSDVAVLRDEGDFGITVWIFHGNGVGYSAPVSPAWSSGPGNWQLRSGRSLATDLNRDGKADLVTMYGYGNGQSKLLAFYGTPTGLVPPAIIWDSGVGNWEWSSSREIAGDFNGDGHGDIMMTYDYGTSSKFWIFYGRSGGIGGSTLAWDSGVNNWLRPYTIEVAGDFNGDGKTDVGGFADYGNNQTKLWYFYGTATGLTCCHMVWDSGPGNWGFSSTKWTTGDFNGDGRADVAAFYNYGNGRSGLWIFQSTATGVAPPVFRWNSGDWGLDWTRFTAL